MEKKKEYSNGEITVVWKPGLCYHAKECVHGLPKVFKPADKPWIQAENASTKELVATINKCPSGALSYHNNSEGTIVEDTGNVVAKTQVEVMENGPLLVYGSIEVTHTTGVKEKKQRSTAFCRCGKTGNNPYCDGSHNG